ncbi:MAG: SIS domain-containing protein [Thiotrichales bacterium]|nr:SIS domain-containing protein [Thiotrichales bacterium]
MPLDFVAIAQAHQRAVDSVFAQHALVQSAANMMVQALRQGNKVLWCGNGGSAAEAQHMAAELMVRYVKNRAPLASIALTTDSSILTAHPNDYEFASVFARQVQGLGRSGDLLVAMSTSGCSENVLLACAQAQRQGLNVLALVGAESQHIAPLADLVIKVDSTQTARIQEAHTLINHLLCESLDLHFG